MTDGRIIKDRFPRSCSSLGKTPLDWIGPAAAASADDHPDAFVIHSYTEEQVMQISRELVAARALSKTSPTALIWFPLARLRPRI